MRKLAELILGLVLIVGGCAAPRVTTIENTCREMWENNKGWVAVELHTRGFDPTEFTILYIQDETNADKESAENDPSWYKSALLKRSKSNVCYTLYRTRHVNRFSTTSCP